VKGIAEALSRFCYVDLDTTGDRKDVRKFTDPYQMKYRLGQEQDKIRYNRYLDELVMQFGYLYEVLAGLGEKSRTVFPALAGKVKLATGHEVPEDFFELKMSVVLPEWPARFQDNDTFRSFVEKLFIDNSPLNMRLHFCWLTIPEMITFEDLYFNWINGVHDQVMESRMATDELIGFLYDRQPDWISL